MSAFAAAVELGYRYVETDVHTTADGVVVAFHDDHLDRVTDRVGRIDELPWSEVQRARLAGGEGVPLLEDLLGTWPSLRVNIDPKHDAAVAPLVEVIERTKAHDRICLGAFSDRRLAALRDLLGDQVCTSLGPRDVARLRAASLMPGGVGRFPGACVQVPPRQGRIPLVDRRFLAAAHRRGLPVHVWTIDERATMETLLDLGVDGLMTDQAALLKHVLVERGQWFEA